MRRSNTKKYSPSDPRGDRRFKLSGSQSVKWATGHVGAGNQATHGNYATGRTKVQLRHNIRLGTYTPPTSNATDDEIEDFYNTFEGSIYEIPKREILMIAGGFNAKVGNTSHDEDLRDIVGH
ncbi:hypothetical protein WA026_006090 [Henosepilachna vigintioctopunctata]|uniref:Uncharacterized protein n=1 Tax=Henosepilachna vigintioctopunctata TaxID=420089 RepID=A0AAW1TP90_9CUCU